MYYLLNAKKKTHLSPMTDQSHHLKQSQGRAQYVDICCARERTDYSLNLSKL